jgi:hypothetical protein
VEETSFSIELLISSTLKLEGILQRDFAASQDIFCVGMQIISL